MTTTMMMTMTIRRRIEGRQEEDDGEVLMMTAEMVAVAAITRKVANRIRLPATPPKIDEGSARATQ